MVKKTVIILMIICFVYALTAYAQEAVAADTLTDVVQSDDSDGDGLDVFDSDDVNLSDSVGVKKTDSLTVKKKDSLDDFDSDEDLEIADALADTASVQKLGSVKRGYDRKRQVQLAIVMMVFLIFALGTSQSFNPH